MQSVVWLVCAASLGVAAGVVRWKSESLRVDLGAPQTIGALEIRLPEGWLMEAGRRGGSYRIVSAEQRQHGAAGRALIVLEQTLDTAPDPLQFLFTHVLDEDADEADADLAEWVSVGPHKAVVLEYHHQTITGRTLRVEKRTAACLMLQGGHAVVIQYLGRGDPGAVELVRQIVQSIRLVDDAGESAPPLLRLPVDGTV